MEDKNTKQVWWIVLIVIVLLAMAFWIFNWRNMQESQNGDIIPMQKIQSSDISAVEKDLNAMDVSSLDSELSPMEKDIMQ